MRPINPDNLIGAGNLYSTVEDLALWNMALEGDRLLPKEWREKMFTVHWQEPHEEHAYTVNYFTRPRESGEELRYTGFSGGSSGFNTDAFRFPTAGLLVVLFDNSTQYNHWRIAPAIHDIVTGSGRDPVLPRPLASDALAKMVAEKGVAAAVEQFEKIRSKPDGEYAIGATEREINSLGYSALRLKDFDLAIDVFKLNVELFPDAWNVYDSLGEAYLAAGETDLGEQAYARSREIRDREGIIMDLVARGEFAAAAAAIERARAGSPATPFLSPGRVGPLFESMLMAGDHADALEVCKVWAMANPGTAGPYFSMARVYTAQNEIDRVKATYRKILEMQPEGRSAKVARERLEALEQEP
jgi:tetratricopeptide (TPR) repeat protein